MGMLHIFCTLDSWFSVSTAEPSQLGSASQGALEPTIPQFLLKLLRRRLQKPKVPEIGSKIHSFQKTVVPGMAAESFWVPRPAHPMSQSSPRPHKCMAGSHFLASCLDFLFFTFTIHFLSASCHVFSACRRQDAICIHKLPGDFYRTVKVTSLDIILPLSALGWHAKLKLIRQDAVHPSLATGFHVEKTSP